MGQLQEIELQKVIWLIYLEKRKDNEFIKNNNNSNVEIKSE